MKTAEEMAQAYQTAMGAPSTQAKYKKGIENTTKNPMEAAAAAQDKYLANIQLAVSSGRYRNNLLRVPFSTWKTNAAGVGAERLQSGAKKAAAKVQEHFRRFQPVYAAIKERCASMPSMSEDDALEKVRVAMRMQKEAAGKV